MSTDTNTSQTPQPLAVLRDYELLDRLGQGGMGSVYLARHSHLDKRVAIKLLPREHLRNPEMVSRFKREMKAVGKLQHPNIIQAHDAGEEKGIHFLVLEYAKGLDLSNVLARYGAVSVSDACEIIRQAAVGLEHAHRHGMVHRDLKPANMVLTWPSGNVDGVSTQPVVKLLDLGLALLNDDQQQSLAKGITGTGQIMGTLDYMAPEQISDTHTVDIRADIYSLGCTLYALLAGAPPFAGAAYVNPYQKIVAHNQETPRPMHEVRKNVPPEVVSILNKMLAKNPADRFTSPIEVAAALEPFCENNTLLSTLVEAEARQSDHKSRGDAVTEALNSSAMQGTSTDVSAQHSDSADDELLELLRSTAIDETITAMPTGTAPATQFKLNIEAKPAIKQVGRTRARDRSRLRVHLIAAVACALVGIVILAVVFRVVTNYGTIDLTLYHDDAQVTVDGRAVRLRPGQEDDEYTIRVTPGRRTLQVAKEGYTTFNRDIEIAKGETKPIGVQLLRVGRTIAAGPASAALDTSADGAPPVLAAQVSAFAADEPPPLEEWLKGREIITVAKDGSGDFDTIQAALDALKPGEVVEVLDRGPYRETLHVDKPLQGAGLISRVGTVVQVDHWGNENTLETAHRFFNVSDLRISGFAWLYDWKEARKRRAVAMYISGDVVIEECLFHATILPPTDTWDLHNGLSVSGVVGTRGNELVTIRDCCFSRGTLAVSSVPGRMRVTRCLFYRPCYRAIQASDRIERLEVRSNVFDVAADGDRIAAAFATGAVVAKNNTVIGPFSPTHRVAFICTSPIPVIFQNNITANVFNGGRGEEPIFDNWQLGNNAFVAYSDGPRFLKKNSDDVVITPDFLSTEFGNANYARVPSTSPTARMGIDAESFAYIGALPPGPAPPEGDWFTRLQERWKDVVAGTASPARTTIVPGDDWRDVLPRVELAEDRVAGNWSFDADALVGSHQGNEHGRVILPVVPQGTYHLRMRFVRTAGEEIVGAVLPVGDRQVAVLFSAWAGQHGGLHLVDGATIMSDQNPAAIRPAKLENNHEYTLLMGVKVVDDVAEIAVELNNERILNWEGEVSRLSNDPQWQLPRADVPALCYRDCSVRYLSADIRMLDGEARLLRSGSQMATDAEEPAPLEE